MAMIATGLLACTAQVGLQRRMDAARAHKSLGQYEDALLELRAGLNERDAAESRREGDLHLQIADVLLDLNRNKEAAVEARLGLASGMPLNRVGWYEAVVAIDEGRTDVALRALERLLAAGYPNVREFTSAGWLTRLRSHPSYIALVTRLLLNAGGIDDADARLLAAAGGIKYRPVQSLIAAPDEVSGACSLMIVQLRETSEKGPDGQSRLVGELVAPRIEGTGTEYENRSVKTEIRSGFSSRVSPVSGGGVLWGSKFLEAEGVSATTIERIESTPTTKHSIVLNPQGLFVVLQYEGVDPGLVQNRVAAVFGCQRAVTSMPRALLQQQRVPMFDLFGFSRFEAGGLPIRRTAAEPVLQP